MIIILLASAVASLQSKSKAQIDYELMVQPLMLN